MIFKRIFWIREKDIVMQDKNQVQFVQKSLPPRTQQSLKIPLLSIKYSIATFKIVGESSSCMERTLSAYTKKDSVLCSYFLTKFQRFPLAEGKQYYRYYTSF